MTRILNWVLALCLVLLFQNHSDAQTIDYVTGNLINFSGSPTSITSNWNNVGSFDQPLTCWKGGDPGYCGPLPRVNAFGSGSINFSYGLTDLNQVINVTNAVAGATGPVSVTGYNFGFRAKNGNGWDDGRVDQLNAYVKLYDPTNKVIENYNYNLTSKYDWTNFYYSQNFTTPHPLSTVATAQIGFVGKDNNYWVGPYGPEITNVSFSLKYSVNPCVTNPGYAPTCPGFNNVITSSNLVPYPGAATSWGGSINNSFAIQTALQNSGSGLIVHGFDYGYIVNATNSYCEAQFIICWSWHSGGSVQVNAGITNAKGQNIYSVSRNYNESGYSNENFHYRFPTSVNQMMLGNFNFAAYTNGDAYVGNMYSRMIYSQDPCVNNPNYAPSCINKPQVTYTAPSITNSSTTKELASTGSTITNVGGVQLSTTGTISAPDNIPQTIKDTQISTQQSLAVQAATPQTINNVQQTKTAPNTKLIASIISQVQANEKTTQTMAVQNANKVVNTSIAQSQEQASSTVATLNAMSAASSAQSNQDIAPIQTPTINYQSASSAVQLQAPVAVSLQNLMSATKTNNEQITVQSFVPAQQQNTINSTNETQIQQTYRPQLNNVVVQESVQEQPYRPQVNNVVVQESVQEQPYRFVPNVQTVQVQPIISNQEVNNTVSEFSLTTQNTKVFLGQMQELPQFVSISTPKTNDTETKIIPKFDTKFNEADTQPVNVNLIAKANSVTEMAETRAIIESVQNEQSGETVKKNVQPNDLAGKVDIAAMATQPKGFDLYSFTLKDASFYLPKEIYGNQKNVDNVRLLRSLSNERLHQEMVDQQYRR